MPLLTPPTKTDESIGREKTDAAAIAPTVAAIVDLLNTPDLDTKVPAAEYERLKDALINVSEVVAEIFEPELVAATGDEVGIDIAVEVDKLTSGIYTALQVDVTETHAPETDNRLLDLKVGGESKLIVGAGPGAIILTEDTTSFGGRNVQIYGNKTTQAGAAIILGNLPELTGTGNQTVAEIAATLNQSGAASYVGLSIRMDEDALGTGVSKPLKIGTGGSGLSEVFHVDNYGTPRSAQWKYKTADETVTGSDTLQADNHLLVTLDAAGVYAFRFRLFHTNTGGGLKVGLGGTATAVHLKAIWDLTDAGPTDLAHMRITALGTGVSDGFNGEAESTIEGTIEVDAGGTFGLQFAQQTGGAGNASVERCSSLVVYKLSA